MSTARFAEIVWFVTARVLIIAVLLSRWYEREHADQAETKRQLARTKPYAGDDHIQDAL